MVAIIAIALVLILLTLWFGSGAVLGGLGYALAATVAAAAVGVVLWMARTIMDDLFWGPAREWRAKQRRDRERERKADSDACDRADREAERRKGLAAHSS